MVDFEEVLFAIGGARDAGLNARNGYGFP